MGTIVYLPGGRLAGAIGVWVIVNMATFNDILGTALAAAPLTVTTPSQRWTASCCRAAAERDEVDGMYGPSLRVEAEIAAFPAFGISGTIRTQIRYSLQ
jgi:hypothetical protein